MMLLVILPVLRILFSDCLRRRGRKVSWQFAFMLVVKTPVVSLYVPQQVARFIIYLEAIPAFDARCLFGVGFAVAFGQIIFNGVRRVLRIIIWVLFL